MKFAHITFLDAIPSPKDGTTGFAFGHDPKSFNGGYELEEKGGWIHVRWPGKGKEGDDVTNVVHPSRVRIARVLADDPIEVAVQRSVEKSRQLGVPHR